MGIRGARIESQAQKPQLHPAQLLQATGVVTYHLDSSYPIALELSGVSQPGVQPAYGFQKPFLPCRLELFCQHNGLSQPSREREIQAGPSTAQQDLLGQENYSSLLQCYNVAMLYMWATQHPTRGWCLNQLSYICFCLSSYVVQQPPSCYYPRSRPTLGRLPLPL